MSFPKLSISKQKYKYKILVSNGTISLHLDFETRKIIFDKLPKDMKTQKRWAKGYWQLWTLGSKTVDRVEVICLF